MDKYHFILLKNGEPMIELSKEFETDKECIKELIRIWSEEENDSY